jgi:hypothetical protein
MKASCAADSASSGILSPGFYKLKTDLFYGYGHLPTDVYLGRCMQRTIP